MVAKVRETVEIDAPIEKVWAVVHEDFKNAKKWTSSLDHIDELTDGPLGKGTELRYTINTAGGNLSENFASIDWSAAQQAGAVDGAVESAIGVLLYQMGIAALVPLAFYFMIAMKAWRNTGTK